MAEDTGTGFGGDGVGGSVTAGGSAGAAGAGPAGGSAGVIGVGGSAGVVGAGGSGGSAPIGGSAGTGGSGGTSAGNAGISGSGGTVAGSSGNGGKGGGGGTAGTAGTNGTAGKGGGGGAGTGGGGSTGGPTGCHAGDGTVFCDDFNDDTDDGWTDSGGTWTVSGGAYQSDSGNSTAGSVWTDQRVEAWIRVIDFTGTSGSYRAGVVARHAGSSFYSFEINGGGDLEVRRNGNTIGGCAPVDANLSENVWYLLRFEVSGAPPDLNFRSFVNGVQRHDCDYSSSGAYASGNAGFITTNAAIDAEFDDIRVWSPIP